MTNTEKKTHDWEGDLYRRPLLDVATVADYLKMSQNSIRQAAKNGDMPPGIRINGRTRWTKDQIDEWLDRTFAPTDPAA